MASLGNSLKHLRKKKYQFYKILPKNEKEAISNSFMRAALLITTARQRHYKNKKQHTSILCCHRYKNRQNVSKLNPTIYEKDNTS